MLTMSLRDRDRLVVLRQVKEGTLRSSEAAGRLGLSTRQLRRLRQRFAREEDGAVIHRARGRPSNRRLSALVRGRALEIARQPLYRDFAPTLLSEHLERDPDVGFVHPSTLRLWLIEAGLWQPAPRRVRHRRRRERRRAFGELVLMDTSVHDWLEGRSHEEIVLIAMIDDATSRLVARFVPRDTGVANRQMIVDYLQTHGRFGALYTDQASHFGNQRRTAKRGTSLEEREAEATCSLIRTALQALECQLILALSPQAKGRVERLFKTLQDRLIKEMRIAGVNSLAGANRFLSDVFIPFWDRRFAIEPQEPLDAHRPLPAELDLDVLFAETETRVVRNDFTFQFRNEHWQIQLDPTLEALKPKQAVTIERRLDGSLRFRWRDHYFAPVRLPARPEKPRPRPLAPRPPAVPHKPAPDHPWRRKLVLNLDTPAPRPSPIEKGNAPAALCPDTPRLAERRKTA